jgi:hypothetical protein
MTWFEMSDECPVCRTEQDTYALIIFKKNIEEAMRIKYREAIRSLEHQVQILRTRRPRSIFPHSTIHGGRMLRNDAPGPTL